MTTTGNALRAPATAKPKPGIRGFLAAALRPAPLFCALSILFGIVIAAVDPPLRGHDEPAHVLRAYAIARGEIIPAADEAGRPGVYLPAAFFDEFQIFFIEVVRGNAVADFRAAFSRYRQRQLLPHEDRDGAVFFPFGGSEGYSPFAYLPYIAAAWLSRLAGFDFLQTFYAMRIMGLVFATLLAAYAIAITPRLKWAFFFIAMLPSALYARAIVSADGVALGSAMLVSALSLHAVYQTQDRAFARAVAMFVCMLTKPPQVAFAFLEGMTAPLRQLRRRWVVPLVVIGPGLAATFVWLWASGAQIGDWRIIGASGVAPEHFSIGWKLRYMLREPLHFPSLVIATLELEWRALWRQLIGILGWLDVPLAGWTYPVLTGVLAVAMVEPLGLDAKTRARVALACTLTASAYALAVFLIFFIKWTPLDAPEIWGIQGRYFLVVLPACAIALSALVNRGPPGWIIRPSAILGAVLSGLASIEAVWRVHW